MEEATCSFKKAFLFMKIPRRTQIGEKIEKSHTMTENAKMVTQAGLFDE